MHMCIYVCPEYIHWHEPYINILHIIHTVYMETLYYIYIYIYIYIYMEREIERERDRERDREREREIDR